MQCLARSAAATARKFRVGCRAGGGCAAGDAQHRAMPGMIDGAWMGRSFSLFFSLLLFFSSPLLAMTPSHKPGNTYMARRRKATPTMLLTSGAK